MAGTPPPTAPAPAPAAPHATAAGTELAATPTPPPPPPARPVSSLSAAYAAVTSADAPSNATPDPSTPAVVATTTATAAMVSPFAGLVAPVAVSSSSHATGPVPVAFYTQAPPPPQQVNTPGSAKSPATTTSKSPPPSALSLAYKAAMKSPPPLPTLPYLPVTEAAPSESPAAATLATGNTKKRAAGPSAGGKKKAARSAAAATSVKDATASGDADGAAAAGDATELGFLPNAPVVGASASLSAAAQYSRLDASDIEEARALGVLNANIAVSLDASSPEYGVAYEKRGGSKAAGCGTDVFPSQKALQERCKQFAMERGFQLYVSGSSSRADGGGNVKYKCKKLHGQQFFDPDTPVEQLQCPFYINGFGLGKAWKITRACFLHNHYKFIGSRLSSHSSGGGGMATMSAAMSLQGGVSGLDGAMGADGGALGMGGMDGTGAALVDANKPRPQRNTTLSTSVLCRMVNEELDKFPSSAIAMSKLDGKLIKRILLSRGHTINHMMASRIKRQIQMNRIKSISASFQRLQGYLDLIVDKNPATTYLFDVDDRGAFKRAMVMPAPTMHAMAYCQKVLAFDRIRPMVWGDDADTKGGGIPDAVEEESDDAVSGVYLYASTKDHNDQVLVFAVALVTEENQENWTWFMAALANSRQLSMGSGWNDYTIFAGRTNGLQQAVHAMWPHASHHLCVRRLVEEELVINKKLPLPEDKKQRIYDLARCESEAEYKQIRQELALTNEAVVNFLDSLNRPSWVKYAFLEIFKKPTYGVISCDLLAGDDAKPPQTMNIKGGGTHGQPPSLSSIPAPSPLPLIKQWFGDELPRSSQPLLVFNRYFMKIAENFHARRKSVELRPLPELVPKRFAQLEQILQGSQRCESVPCSNGTFMVRSLAHLSSMGHDTWRHVNLLDWECTCLDWQDRLFPCVHGIHAAELNRRRIDSLYHGNVYSVEHYKTCYEVGFTPWPLESATLAVDETLTIPLEELYVQDPNVKRKPGPRPRTKKQVELLTKVVV